MVAMVGQARTERHFGSDEPLTYSVEQAAKRLGISRSLAYDSVRTGAIPTLRLGARVLVPRAALERMVDRATEGMANESAA